MPPPFQHLLADAFPQYSQMRQQARPVLAEQLQLSDQPDTAVHRHPRLDLGMGEVALLLAADLPDSLVRALPHPLQMREQAAHELPSLRPAGHPHLAGRVEAAEGLAVHIKLELVPGAVSYPYG